ncbi:hypothetical protein QGN23_04855 [Chryseobacterium gotjawalense]|uniref:Lipoprotein n=1 Tax=Chryseobacterium gotjawalense TaxID=3042315 RepID=A0ABY8RFX6_9FLAO|nr:hypothetical protein [Chryseobacterium sp. wdc7]WHF52609.1 hypothetical protein QGN23_04855 [Chryseobacterium sp. wdc7]
MKNNIICFVLFLFLTSCLKTSNTPLNLVNVMQEADSLNLLSDSATISNYTHKNLIPLFHLYNNSKKAIILKYLTKSKEKNNLLLAEELIKKNYSKINKCDLGTKELIQYYNLYSKCNKNSELSQINWNKIYEDDQMYRRLFNKYNNDSQKLDSIGRLTIKQDSINREFVKSLIKKHTLNKILDDDCDCLASKSIFYIAQHSDMEINFRKEILEYVSKSNSYSLNNKAYLIDRDLVSEKKKQKFGTQLKFNADTKKLGSDPIEDVKNLDSLRYEYNLPKLSIYLKYVNKIR